MRQAIFDLHEAGTGTFSIDFNANLGTITLASELFAINKPGSLITINGNGNTLSGDNQFRGLFIYRGTVDDPEPDDPERQGGGRQAAGRRRWRRAGRRDLRRQPGERDVEQHQYRGGERDGRDRRTSASATAAGGWVVTAVTSSRSAAGAGAAGWGWARTAA